MHKSNIIGIVGKEVFMNTTDYGTLQIRTYRASEALPIHNTVVKIVGSGEYNSEIMISRLTDVDGLTEEIPLPTPNKSLSLSPSPPSVPYSVFDVDVVKEGYYPKKIFNVPIFAGTKAVLPIEMVPVAYDENGAVIPIKNLNSIIYENNL